MKEDTRTPKQIIVLGTNGTGKTTFVKKLVISELKKKDSHILIVVPDDMEWNTVEFVHPKMFTFSTHIVLFRTLDNIAGRKNVITNFDELKEAQARINLKALKDPHTFEILKTI